MILSLLLLNHLSEAHKVDCCKLLEGNNNYYTVSTDLMGNILSSVSTNYKTICNIKHCDIHNIVVPAVTSLPVQIASLGSGSHFPFPIHVDELGPLCIDPVGQVNVIFCPSSAGSLYPSITTSALRVIGLNTYLHGRIDGTYINIMYMLTG